LQLSTYSAIDGHLFCKPCYARHVQSTGGSLHEITGGQKAKPPEDLCQKVTDLKEIESRLSEQNKKMEEYVETVKKEKSELESEVSSLRSKVSELEQEQQAQAAGNTSAEPEARPEDAEEIRRLSTALEEERRLHEESKEELKKLQSKVDQLESELQEEKDDPLAKMAMKEKDQKILDLEKRVRELQSTSKHVVLDDEDRFDAIASKYD